MPLTYADREVDLTEQEHEDDAERDQVVPAIWRMTFDEVYGAVKKFVDGEA